MPDDHIHFTIEELDHYFANRVNPVRWFHRGLIPACDFERQRKGFIDGLERALALPESHGVTRDHLQEMIELARGDWSDVDTIKSMYRRYHEIIGREYNEAKLFERE